MSDADDNKRLRADSPVRGSLVSCVGEPLKHQRYASTSPESNKYVTRVIRTIFLFSLLIGSTNVAYSCTCLQTSHRKEFRQADAVFVGRVIEVAEDKSYVPPKLSVPASFQKLLDSQRRYLVRFVIEQKFKGVAGKEITLSTYRSDSPCSAMGFSNGETYLIYVHRNEGGGLEDGGLCSRTRKFDESSKEYNEVKSFWFRFRSRLPLLS